MKEELIKELAGFKTTLEAIDASFESIKYVGHDHTKQLETVGKLETIYVDISNRIDRFYSDKYTYKKELIDIKNRNNAFKTYFIEISPLGDTVASLKTKAICILEGMTSELKLYGPPAETDPKFDVE